MMEVNISDLCKRMLRERPRKNGRTRPYFGLFARVQAEPLSCYYTKSLTLAKLGKSLFPPVVSQTPLTVWLLTSIN